MIDNSNTKEEPREEENYEKVYQGGSNNTLDISSILA
jgi:hypothetical protein